MVPDTASALLIIHSHSPDPADCDLDSSPTPAGWDLADVDRIEAELSRHDKGFELHRYEGAGHAFLNFTNAERHRPAQAQDAWRKLLDFLGRHLS